MNLLEKCVSGMIGYPSRPPQGPEGWQGNHKTANESDVIRLKLRQIT
jgi:hypothetical protein